MTRSSMFVLELLFHLKDLPVNEVKKVLSLRQNKKNNNKFS